MARASGKTCYALPAAQPCTFCPLLAEADLLTNTHPVISMSPFGEENYTLERSEKIFTNQA
jgi:hypothetical protein